MIVLFVILYTSNLCLMAYFWKIYFKSIFQKNYFLNLDSRHLHVLKKEFELFTLMVIGKQIETIFENFKNTILHTQKEK